MNETAFSPTWIGARSSSMRLRELRVLGIKTQPALDWTNPTTLFRPSGIFTGQGEPQLDVTRDGKRILLIVFETQPSDTRTQEIQIVLNWQEELTRSCRDSRSGS